MTVEDAHKEEPTRSNNGARVDLTQEPVADSDPVKDVSNTDDTSTIAAASVINNGVATEENAILDGDSEAETLIVSPEKQKDLLDRAPRLEPPAEIVSDEKSIPQKIDLSSGDRLKKRKRTNSNSEPVQHSSRRSSPLSSPVAGADRRSDSDDNSDPDASSQSSIVQHRRRPPGRPSNADRAERAERLEREKREALAKQRRRRQSDASQMESAKRRDRQRRSLDAGSNGTRRDFRSATDPRQSSSERSVSPVPIAQRTHKRAASIQAAHLNTLALKQKKRIPPPLGLSRRNRSSDRRSANSDDSESPAPTRPHLSKIASTDNDAMSPAKTGPRKHKDKNGRTWLARACAIEDLESAKTRLAERPDDINVADNAGNTPLQIAALEGFVEIVEFLLKKRCKVDTKNIDQETPLIDAVENGHVEVVRLLLNAGADPRQGNLKGIEVYDLAKAEDEEIKRMIREAKNKDARRRKSDDQTGLIFGGKKEGSSRAASATSARDSPPIIGPRSPPANSSRRRARENTRNDLLWQANTQENLAKLAGQGDSQGVANILNILQKAEPESLIAAARGKHDEVLGLILGMGNPDPDPEPVRSSAFKSGHNTPILAAIGRGNLTSIRLLLDQTGFDPMKEFKGQTYAEISRDRKGENWERECEMLKEACDKYAANKARKHNSPRKSRDVEKERRRAQDSSSPAPSRKANPSSLLTHKDLTGKATSSSRDIKRDPANISRSTSDVKRQRQREEPSASASDHDMQDRPSKAATRTQRRHSDLPKPDDMVEVTKRRRLISGKEHRRKASVVSEESDDDSEILSVKVKKEVKDKPVLKRQRDSPTSDRPQSRDSDHSRTNSKKRRIVSDSSPEENRPKAVQRRASAISVTSQHILAPPVDSSSVLSAVDNIFRKSKEKPRSPVEAHPPESVPEKNSEPTTISLESEATAKQKTLDAAAAEAEKQRLEEIVREQREEAERRKAAEQARLEQEAKAKAEQEAADQAARQAEEERLAAEKRIADEAAARKKAEEEALARKRMEEERQERLKREAEERQRRLEEQKQRQSMEVERRRRESLPGLLCKTALLLENNDPIAKSRQWLVKYLPIFTVRTKQLDPECESSIAHEEWVPNFQVAGLLGTKDLNLRQYTSLEKRSVTSVHRDALWRVARNMLSYDYDANAFNTTLEMARDRELENRPKFFIMQELFWVKVSLHQSPLALD